MDACGNVYYNSNLQLWKFIIQIVFIYPIVHQKVKPHNAKNFMIGKSAFIPRRLNFLCMFVPFFKHEGGGCISLCINLL